MLMMMMNIIILLIMLLNHIQNMKNTKNYKFNIESGFNNMNNSKINLSMNFMFIMIIFILFDIEMLIIIPLILNQSMNQMFTLYSIKFLMFMMITSFIELKNNKINWII